MQITIFLSITSFLLNAGIVTWGVWSLKKIARQEAEQALIPLKDTFEEHLVDKYAHSEAFEHQIEKLFKRLDQITDRLDSVSRKLDTLIGEHSALTKNGNCPVEIIFRNKEKNDSNSTD